MCDNDPCGRNPCDLMRVPTQCYPQDVCHEHDAGEQLGGDREPHEHRVAEDDSGDCGSATSHRGEVNRFGGSAPR